MLRPKGYFTLILCFSLAFFLLSSSIVSSFMVVSRTAMGTSEGEGEDEGSSEAGQQQNQDDEQASGDEGDEQPEATNQQPPLEDVPPEAPPQVGNQPVACSGVVNEDTGECEEVQQVKGGSQEICDNSVDDNRDGNVDESSCVPSEGQQQMDASSTIPPSFAPNPSPGESSNWGLPPADGGSSPTESTEITNFGSPSPSDSDATTTPSDAPIPSFSPQPESGMQGATETTDSTSREQITESTLVPPSTDPESSNIPPTMQTPAGPAPAMTYEQWHSSTAFNTKPPCDSPPDVNRMKVTNYDQNCPVQYKQLQQQQQQPSTASPVSRQPQQQAVPEPPTGQPTDPEPVDLAQLCNSLTIETVTNLDCSQFQPSEGTQPSAEPTDQSDGTAPSQLPSDRNAIFIPSFPQEQPTNLLPPTRQPQVSAWPDDPDDTILSVALGLAVRGLVEITGGPGKQVIIADTNPQDQSAHKKAFLKGFTSLPRLMAIGSILSNLPTMAFDGEGSDGGSTSGGGGEPPSSAGDGSGGTGGGGGQSTLPVPSSAGDGSGGTGGGGGGEVPPTPPTGTPPQPPTPPAPTEIPITSDRGSTVIEYSQPSTQRVMELAPDPARGGFNRQGNLPLNSEYEGTLAAVIEDKFGGLERAPLTYDARGNAQSGADYISQSGPLEGQSFDIIGVPPSQAGFVQVEGNRGLLNAITEHARDPWNTIVDVSNYNDAQQAMIRDHIGSLPLEEQQRIFVVGVQGGSPPLRPLPQGSN
jgi:CdiA C-terminal tRNase domain